MSAAAAYRLYRKARDRAFTRAVSSSFAGIGSRTSLALPVELHGAERMSIGSHVYVGPGCSLLTHNADARLEIGDRTSIAGYCVLSAARNICVGRSVLLARNVYIADHRHGVEDAALPVIEQPLTDLRPITIEDGAWLGQNVVILPGVMIGRNAIVGANSVVREDVPARCVAVGAPARVVRQLS